MSNTQYLYNEIKPVGFLSDHIDAYWTVVCGGESEQQQRVLPDGCLDLIIGLDGECTTGDDNIILRSGHTYLIGAMDRYQLSTMSGHVRLVGIRFNPGRINQFFRLGPLRELTNRVDMFDYRRAPDVGKLRREGFNYLDNWLERHFDRRFNPVEGVINDVLACNGRIAVRELAERHFMTQRQLERVFNYWVGLGPKVFADIVRVRYVLNQIKKAPRRSLLSLAVEAGYYDHAHLSNAVKRYTGYTPTEF